MISSQIQFDYSGHKVEEFSFGYSAMEFVVETDEMKMKLDRFHFEELRQKLNKLHDEVN